MKFLERIKNRTTEAVREEFVKTVNADILPLAVSGLGAIFTIWSLMRSPQKTGDTYHITYNITNNYYRKVR